MLPADVLKKVIELLKQLHRADKDHQGSTVFIYAPGSQYVETVQNQYLYPAPSPAPYRGGESTKGETAPHKPHPLTPSPTGEGERPWGGELPDVLATDEAMVLWRKAQRAGYVDEHFQPLISRTQAALLADAMAERLGIKEKWKVFEGLWHRKYMYHDYYRAMEQQQSLDFQDTLKRLFE